MRFKIFTLTVLFAIYSLFVLAQGEANIWYFGKHAGLDFSSGNPVVLTNGKVNAIEGCASISDAAGSLLFYTDGDTVWDRTHTIMPSIIATGVLKGGEVTFAGTTQSSVIVKKPGSSTIYYIFTLDDSGGADGLSYSEVDMSLNGGFGDINANKNIPLHTPSCEKLIAVRHCNGKDAWIVIHDRNSNTFRIFPVTSAGVGAATTYNVGTSVAGASDGQLKASPDGKKLACVSTSATGILELYDFNPATGVVSNPILLINDWFSFIYGVEFSPDGTKLYTGSIAFNNIYQFDICAGSSAAIIASKTTIGPFANGLWSMQLGPDKKIYVARDHVPFLGVINNPNALGSGPGGCNYVDDGVALAAGDTSLWGLPNFINSYLKPILSYTTTVVNCLTRSFTAPTVNLSNCSGSTNAIASLSWDFNDPASGTNNTSTISNPSHNYTTVGSYTVVLLINYACGTDTLKQNIILGPLPTTTITSVNVDCKGNNSGTATVMAGGGTAPYIYQWSNNKTTATINNIPSSVYSITVTDNNGCITTATVSITEPAFVLTASLTATDVLCNSGTNGIVTTTVSGGTPSYSYQWSNNKTTATINNLPSTIYSVTVTDGNGCSINKSINVSQPSAITINISTISDTCNQSIGSATLSAIGGTGSYTYIWNNLKTTTSITHLIASVYSVTVTDANGCTSTSSNIISSINTLTITISPDVTIASGENTVLSAWGGSSYQWIPSAGLSCTTCANPTASPELTTEYCVEITDANGCSENECVTVTVETICGEIFVPTAFSPNGDLMNDSICLYQASCIQSGKFTIYNRWGEIVFESTDPKACWDGIHTNKAMTDALFYYILEGKTIKEETISKNGTVVLIR